MRNLIYTGGIFHDFAGMADALVGTLSEAGFRSEVCDDIEACADQLDAGGVDLFTVCALRWSMRDGEKYAPYRQRWSLIPTPRVQQAIERHVLGGGGLLGLHTAVICFDEWPQWQRLLGGAWEWGRSSHPPQGRIQVQYTADEHALTRGLPRFDVVDELYMGLALSDDVHVLATGRLPSDPILHPVLWAHAYGGGRVVCDTLGHDGVAIREPGHAKLLRRAAAWAARSGASHSGAGVDA